MALKINLDWKSILTVVKTEFDLVAATLRDKGGQRFGKAFGLAGFCAALVYFVIYRPPQKKIVLLTREVEKAKALSEVGAQYKELRDQLASVYAALPQMKDREQWLSNAMINSLRAENLTPDSFKPVNENELYGLIFQASTVKLTLKFSEFYSWLMRLEGAKPMMHIQSLDIQKKSDMLGWNGVTCEVMTVIPKKRFN